MKRIVFTALLICCGLHSHAQKMRVQEEETIRRSLSFAQNTDRLLILKNISGSIEIEGYEGNTVEMEARQVLKGRDQAALEHAKEEVRLITRVEGDIILIYPEDPDVKAELKGRRFHYHVNRHDPDYHSHYDFRLRVPRNVSLQASTVNDGEVRVKNVEGKNIQLHNVNGSIKADKVSGLTEAHTVNGEIEVSYTQKPTQDAEFHTINGDINVICPENLSADVRFKSMNGDLYTNYPEVQTKPGIEQTSAEKGNKKMYRLNQSTLLQINNGGPLLDFNVLNGNVYVKKY
ncbi:DUF4097 and DUF4098 domain-containing protein YvlB [Catalinimonas alkaloidigena]|uniref:DUF4097 family beta strand repeat-containing protein n=1 Tax=Catalinimonas alkaloidigena TaxID=1075417 RepID=UPI0024065C1F|nr:DUF4097 family beta strand repeat-containing protein [Catalinimonas alkaloidigena]MDF9795063.1 DUF4097 and DUF4098 domain-containing protein YvlB [Catalinimonas alkaloidigena]